MTKEEAAAMFSGKPVAPKNPEGGAIEREVHGYVVDKETTEKLVNAVFKSDPQVAYADTIALFATIRKGDIDPKVCASFGHAVNLAKVFDVNSMSIFLHGMCFTREGYVVATLDIGPRGFSLGLREKHLHPFDGGYSDSNVVMTAKEIAKQLDEEIKAVAKRLLPLYLPQSPDEVASAILAAIESLPKED